MATNTTQPAVDIPPIVLLVEDDADTREMYETALKLEGLWVAHAVHGAEALEYAADLLPDALVTDIELGGLIDGVTLVQELRGFEKTAYIPVVAVTGLPDRISAAGRHLFSTVLTKPVDVPQFVRAVQDVLERSRGLRTRSERVRQRVPELLDRSNRLVARSRHLARQAAVTVRDRACPNCDQPLEWIERRDVHGVLFDYYRPCANGCGLFCYDHAEQQMVTLIG